jgi:hypothetical protein
VPKQASLLLSFGISSLQAAFKIKLVLFDAILDGLSVAAELGEEPRALR